ncbi:MAG: DUF6290 family protein [Spirochaetota bacterium]|nr:DUF6290 family protein [Spirochaetota bacterium]
MAVTSVRFNAKEDKILKLLQKHYNCDTSSLIKKSLWQLYEDIKDKEIIEDFEKKEKSKKARFVSIDNIIQ